MLEQLRRVLADIPDSTKDFDVINRKIGEMEARVEQSMRKIAQMERQAMDAAAKTAASATAGNTGGNLSIDTKTAQQQQAYNNALKESVEQSIKAREAAADLRDILDSHTKTYSEQVVLLNRDASALKDVREEMKLLTQSFEAHNISADEYSDRMEEDLKVEQELKVSISQRRVQLNALTKQLSAETGSYAELTQVLGRARDLYRDLYAAKPPTEESKAFLANIKALDAELKKADASMGNYQRSIGSYKEALSGLLPVQVNMALRMGELINKGGGVIPTLKGIGASIALMTKNALAFIATPFGFILTAIAATTALVVKNWRKLKNTLGITTPAEDAAKALEKLNKQLDYLNNNAEKANTSALNKYTEAIQKAKGDTEALTAAQKAYNEELRATELERAERALKEAYKAEQNAYTAYQKDYKNKDVLDTFLQSKKAVQEAQADLAKIKNDIAKAESETIQTTNKNREEAAKKATEIAEKTAKQLEEALKKLRDDALQAEVDSMKDGTAKKLAQIDLDYQKRARAIQEAEKKLFELQKKEIDAQYKNDTSSERFLAGQQMVAQYKGNVEHLARPLVAAAELVKKGWEDAGEGIATVFSSQFGILDAKGKVTEILVTPILPNGDILSPQELEDYIYTQLEGAQDILAADTKGLVIATNVAADGSAGEKYHELQKVYYADNIKAAEGVREYATAVREANQALKDEEWMNAFLSEAGIKNTKEYLNEQLDAWNEYYMKYGTILEKMQATKEYYDRKISLAKDAGTAEALRAEKDAAMAALEVEGGDFVNSLISKTKEDIEKLKREIKVALKTLEDEFNKLPSSDSEQGDDLRNKINVLRAQLSAINKLDPVSDEEHSESFEKWQKLYSTLTKIEGQFNDIGEAAGGAMGEVISTASKITVNSLKMIDSIKTLAENSAEGIEKTGEVAATTIQKVERASVILAIIQAALKVIQSIASIFGDTETSMERNIREAQELNEELRVMNERARLNSDIFSTIFGHDAFGDYVNNVTALTDAMNAYQATMDKIRNRGEEFEFVGSKGEATGLANLRKRAKEWENLYASIANMQVQVRHSTWLRSAKYKSLKDMLPELFEGNNVNMQALKEFVEGNSDTFKHLTKENQTYLKELVNNWETYEEAIKAVNDYLNDMFGELGTTLTDALVDSFEQGTNAADAFGEAAGNMLKNLAKQVLYTATIGPEIEKAQKKIDAINRDLSLSDEERYNALAGVVDTMLDDVLAQQKVGQELWERLKQAAEERGLQWETEAGGQEATSRGFQAMSQDTGDELNGRFTDIQGKVTDIRGYVMMQTQSIIGLLNSIGNIETAIYTSVQVDNELLRYAVMTYMEIVEINGNTAVMKAALTEIREDIAAIKRNTSEL